MSAHDPQTISVKKRLRAALDKIRPDLAGKAGLSLEEVKKQLSFFPYYLGEEVYEFYQWAGAPQGQTLQLMTNDKGEYDWLTSDGTHAKVRYSCGLPDHGFSEYNQYYSIEELFIPSESNLLSFWSREGDTLAFIGSSTPVYYSPIVDTWDIHTIWSPSLTNWLEAMAETTITLGYTIPYDLGGGYYGNSTKEKEELLIYQSICQKYGFSGWLLPL